MKLLFCQKCGSIMQPKHEGKKNVLVCSCGYKQVEKEDLKIKEAGEKKQKLVIAQDMSMEAMPETKETCPKCKNEKAYYWTQQTRAGDEAETKFFQCAKCGHRWRDYN